ncbi:sensor histidine kinase [Anaerovorax sp. IOR16]|uniref:sensor histidine kinase n=1 Tax=Anaerovorax sp. IOR16 TaxID=2773458 RepID=UPI0019D0A18B|nr:sensor histidine kinase [Anaerovorax sp. IOR16]
MRLIGFLKDKIIFIVAQIFLIIFISTLFKVLKISDQAVVLITFFILLIMATTLLYEYIKKSRYYRRLYSVFDNMEKKQYIAQFLEEPDFIEAEILCDILKQATKAMNDEIAVQKIAEEEYKEYIETWIHEVKLPISCIDLICKNNNNDITQSVSEEVMRIDAFVEQALFYARSSVLEKDYFIRDVQLDTMIKSVVKKHSKQLISAKAELDFGGLQYIVYSDPKWLDFILGQLISNSIKYRSENFKLSFSATENETQVILAIKDNGIGIAEKDLKRVFEKGFTGKNGRGFGKSTGIGLYLCKKMCDKMHLQIEISSEEGIGTCVSIVFPKDKSIMFE